MPRVRAHTVRTCSRRLLPQVPRDRAGYVRDLLELRRGARPAKLAPASRESRQAAHPFVLRGRPAAATAAQEDAERFAAAAKGPLERLVFELTLRPTAGVNRS